MDLSKLSYSDLIAVKNELEKEINQFLRKYSFLGVAELEELSSLISIYGFETSYAKKVKEFFKIVDLDAITIYHVNMQKEINDFSEIGFQQDMDRLAGLYDAFRLFQQEYFDSVYDLIYNGNEENDFSKDSSNDTFQSKCYDRHWELKGTNEYKSKVDIVTKMIEERDFEGKGFENVYKAITRETNKRKNTKKRT